MPSSQGMDWSYFITTVPGTHMSRVKLGMYILWVLGKKLLRSGISHFVPCAVWGHPKLTLVNVCYSLYSSLQLLTWC